MSLKSRCFFLHELSRYFLAALLLFSGFVKAVDPIGTVLKTDSYFIAFGMDSHPMIAEFAGIGLIFVECLLGILLLMGKFKRLTAFGTLLFMGAMTLVTLYLAITNAVSDCGCFGDFLHIDNRQTFLKNLLFMVPAIVLFLGRKNQTLIFPTRASAWCVLGLGIFGTAFFIQQNLRHQPLWDFRPYKVGKNLAELTTIPEGAPQDVYRYQFVYEKEGKQHIFPEDSLPDDSWQFVETRELLVSRGYHPPVEDFAIYRNDEEVTEEMLKEAEGRVIWITAPLWEDSNERIYPALNSLYEVSHKAGIGFYALSGSDKDAEARWRGHSQAHYPALLVDATTLKTLARGNPAVVLMKEGIIWAKLDARDLESEALSEQISNLFSSDRPRQEPFFPRIIPIGLWLILTLAAIFSKGLSSNIKKRASKTNLLTP